MSQHPQRSAALTDLERSRLRGCFLFCQLSDAYWKAFSQDLESTRFDNGAVIYSPQHFRAALGYVLTGQAACYKPGGTLLNTIRPGECFGVAALFEENAAAYVSTITAHKSCKVVFITQEKVEGMLRDSPDAAMSYIRFLTGRIRFLNGKIDSYTAGTAENRLRRYLAEAADENGKVVLKDGAAALSRTLSVSRASLYRAIASLSRSGQIRKEKNRLILLEPFYPSHQEPSNFRSNQEGK